MTDDVLSEAREAFDLSAEVENDNRLAYIDDVRFARLEEQWPDNVKRQRNLEGRPCLTINKLPPLIRQVVNDARQNKPAITCHPADSEADPETALILDGLIRQIEYASSADVAYDTALECGVTGGFGYIRVALDYARDDTFEQDIRIKRVADPLCVYGDPYSTAADSSDWNTAFYTDLLTKKQFKARFKDAECVDWESDFTDCQDWLEGDNVRVAEWWTREETVKQIVALKGISHDDVAFNAPDLAVSMGGAAEPLPIFDLEVYEKNREFFDAIGATVQGSPRPVKGFKVRCRLMSGAEVLEETDWAGKYIPIVPVYGEEINLEGKRYFRSMIRSAKDAQRMFNYWRPLSLDTPLPTPSGWTTMGAVQVGDQLFDEQGQPCTVIGKSPVHINRECFRVEFDDGTSIVADKEHPWAVEARGKRKAEGWLWSDAIVTTGELEPGQHFIKTPRPLDTPDVELPVHPYLLGAWLGDGIAVEPVICQSDGDIDEMRAIVAGFGHTVGEVRGKGDRIGKFTVHGVRKAFSGLGLLNNKHVPDIYLRASRIQREMLLQGMMDTDGSISANGQCGFTNTNPAISEGFAELLRTLGIKAVRCRRVGRQRLWADGSVSEHAPADQFSFTASASDNVFRLSRKASIQRRSRVEHTRRTKRFAIRSITPVASVPVQCVAIDAPSHLFLAGEGMVPTHNTNATEMVALAPKAPFIGPKGAFDSDAANWSTANTATHPYLEYDGPTPPQRQQFDGSPIGALQEALNASDDMKSITGIYDASLGARSNETSGRAIIARQREGDVSTFAYIDNLSRGIAQVGRIIVDLIPHVYSAPRILRILGPDKKASMVVAAKATTPQEEIPQLPPKPGQAPQMPGQPPAPSEDDDGDDISGPDLARVYDLTTGTYDITVEAGPSYSTRRQESAEQMMQFVQAMPNAAPIIGDLIAANLDWPGAKEIGKRLKQMLPPQAQGQDPQLMQAQQQLQMAGAEVQKLNSQLEAAKADNQAKMAEVQVKGFDAETKRIEAETARRLADAEIAKMAYDIENPPEPEMPDTGEQGFPQ